MERSFPEIRINIEYSVLEPAGYSRPVLFGVVPLADQWPTVRRHWKLAAVTHQRMCVAEAGIPNSSEFVPLDKTGTTARLFVLELCDLASCEAMISAYESTERRSEFSAVARLRLDMAWEMVLPLPRHIPPAVVYLPKMGCCYGANDKFAIGGRNAMRLYLTRVTVLAEVWPIRRICLRDKCTRSPFSNPSWNWPYTSEEFLKGSARFAQYALRERPDWMYCQFGDRVGLHADDIQCTARLRLAMRCEQLSCGWCARGCSCWKRENSSCALAAPPPPTLSVPPHKPLCFNLADYKIPPHKGADLFPVRGQLFVGGSRRTRGQSAIVRRGGART